MLLDKQIAARIIEINKQYEGYKDFGETSFNFIVQRIKVANRNEKEIIIRFLLNEIVSNKYNLEFDCISILEKLKLDWICKEVLSIYNVYKYKKNETWINSLIYLLLNIGCSDAKEVIAENLENNLSKSGNSPEIFYKSILFSRIDFEDAKYFFLNYLLENIDNMHYSNLGFFFLDLLDDEDTSLAFKLIYFIKLENIYTYNKMKNLMILYLNSNLSNDISLINKKSILNNL